MIVRLITLSILVFLASSCMTHRHTVGDGPMGAKGKTQVHSRAKQAYLFWGLLPLGRPEPARPSHGNYQIKTSFNVADSFLGVITFGIVNFRTIRILTYKQDNIFNEEYRVGEKITFIKNKEIFIAEIIALDASKGKITCKFLNIYGESIIEEKKIDSVSPLTEELYLSKLEERNKEISKYKYNVGQFVTWSKAENTFFGKVIFLDNKSHKATIETTNIFDAKENKNIPFLDLTTISLEDFNSKEEIWTQEKNKYKFQVGEKVFWSKNKGSEDMQDCEIISLDNNSNQAEVKYINEKNEEKIIKKSYLQLIKK